MSYALLIDDDTGLTSGLAQLASSEGLELLTANSWEAGLALFHATRPVLVIADYNLPGSDHGLRLLLAISRLRPSVRLLLVSAYLSESDVARVEELGLVDRVLRKLDAIDTNRALLEEIRDAAGHAGDDTDWVAFAEANRRSAAVSEDDFRRLDEFLQSSRLPGAGGNSGVGG
jgi:CheY-like chemotaxis protein